jgi:hypothetical protein
MLFLIFHQTCVAYLLRQAGDLALAAQRSSRAISVEGSCCGSPSSSRSDFCEVWSAVAGSCRMVKSPTYLAKRTESASLDVGCREDEQECDRIQSCES